MAKKKLFIYVGPHRSGSNYLQTKIFPNVPGLFTAYSRNPDLNYILWDGMEQHPSFVDIEDIRRELHEEIEKIDEDAILLSEEEFFGDYGRRNAEGVHFSQPFYDNEYKTDFIGKIFDNPKIIMTLRRQDKWVESAYMHFIHNYHSFTMDQFLNPKRYAGAYYSRPYTDRARNISCDFKMLDWGVYVENYFRLFGRENVLVLPLEMSLENHSQFLSRIYDFMGVEPYYPDELRPVNRSLSKRAYKLAMIFNRFIRSEHNRWGFIPDQPFNRWIREQRAKKDTRLLWFLAGISRRVNLFWFLRDVVSRYNYERPEPLEPEQRQEILEYYKEPNKKYADLIGFDLSQYGYY